MNGRRQGPAVGSALLLVAVLFVWLARGERAEHSGPASPMSADHEAPVLPTFGVADDQTPVSVDVPPIDEESAPAPTSRAARLVVHVTWSDASPAAGVHLACVAFDQPHPLRHVVTAVTDATGTSTIEPAPLGDVVVYSDRGESVAGVVKDGETTEVSLALAAGTLVRGLVVDQDDRPAPGADVWLSDFFNHTEGTIVAQAGADGRFELRDVSPFRYIGARLAGHVPSFLATIAEDAPVLDVRLQLGSAGATLRGLVVQTGGTPVVGASVEVGPESGWPGSDLHAAGNGPPPVHLQTEADGTFLAADLPAGTIPVAVSAEGWSPWTGWERVAAGESKDLRIELPASAWVEGIVRDDHGAPIAEASIHAGSYGNHEWVETSSDAQGHFILRDLPLSKQLLVASKKGVGENKRTFWIEPGKSYAWEPVLSAGLQIAGTVVDESGVSVQGLHVQVEHEMSSDGWSKQGDVAADGRFAVANCQDVDNSLAVFASDWAWPPLVTMAKVRPGPDELRVVIPAGARQLATLTGRVADSHGAVAQNVQVSLMRLDSPFGFAGKVEGATGEFTIEKVPMGSYRLSAKAEGLPTLLVAVNDVQPGENRNLGPLALQDPAVLVVRLQLSPGLDAKQVECHLLGSDGVSGTASFAGMEDGLLERRSGPTSPGEWLLVVTGSYALPVRQPITLAGGETRVDVTVEKGVKQRLDFVMPYAENRRIELWVTDASGAEVAHEARDATPFPDRGESRGIVILVFRPGHYSVRVALDGQDSLQAGFDVPAGADKAPTQEFKMS